MKFEGGLTLKVELGHFTVQIIEKIKDFFFKAAGADMKYFSKSKFLKSLVYKKKFTLIWKAVSKLEYLSRPGSSDEISAKSEYSESFAYKKKFTSIWMAVSKLEYLLSQGSSDASFVFKRTR